MTDPTKTPLSVLAAILEREESPDEAAALAVKTDEADRARSLKTLSPIWQDLIAAVSAERWQTAVAAACGADLAQQMVSSPAWPTLTARLRVLDAA
ncbi:MAG TPA: hypothetical protein VGH66_13770 [Acidimicrobiales bacterium]